MTDQILPAIIAGIVALTVSIVSSWLTNRSTAKKLSLESMQLRQDRLLDLRLQSYPRAFAITGRMRFRKGDKSKPEELGTVADDLREWWVGTAAALLSSSSVETYYTFQVAIKRCINFSNRDVAEYQRLYQANSEFRRQLRKDIGLDTNMTDIDADA